MWKFQRDFKGRLKIILEMQNKIKDVRLKDIKIEILGIAMIHELVWNLYASSMKSYISACCFKLNTANFQPVNLIYKIRIFFMCQCLYTLIKG